MIIEMHDGLTKPVKVHVTRLLVMTDDGKPIAFTVDYAPNHWRTFHAGDKDFALRLQEAGFNRTVVVEHIELPK